MRNTILIFAWSFPCFLGLSLLSLFFTDEFLGIWFYPPWDYPFSYAIASWVSISCAAILLTIFQPSNSVGNLFLILPSLYIGFLLDIGLIVYLLFGIFNEFNEGSFLLSFFLVLVFLISFPVTFKQTSIIILLITLLIIRKNKTFFLGIFTKIIALLTNKNLWIFLGMGIIFVLVPVLIPLILALFFGVRLGKPKAPTLSQKKRLVYLSPLLAAFIIGFVANAKTNIPPGTVIPRNIRHEWGMHAFNIYPTHPYQESIGKLRRCNPIKNEIGEIKKTALVEGNNYLIFPFWDEGLSAHLNIELVGEKGTAIAKACFAGKCRRERRQIKHSDEDKAKIYSLVGTKKIDISKCL